MSTKDKRVDAYIAKSKDFARPILNHLRKLVHQGCPDVVETVKWGMPSFEYKGLLCGMAAFKEHCTFGFWKAKLMDEYDRRLAVAGEAAMGHFGRIASLKDLPSDAQILKLVKEARRLNEAGVKIERPKSPPKKPLVVPAYFKKELSKNAKAKAAFDAFSYSHRKDYVEWVTEAKTEATRAKRMATTVQWLAEGKGRNWKYEK